MPPEPTVPDEILQRYRRDPDEVPTSDDPATEILRLGCLTYGRDDGPDRWADARRLFARDPSVVRGNLHLAAAVADLPAVQEQLRADPAAADALGGPFGWTPLVYLAYARLDPDRPLDDVLATASALLEAGADPDAGYLWHGLPMPFTVLTGLFGEGELGPSRQPRHPHSAPLARLVLTAGADANDGQTLYNRMFQPVDDHLELLFQHGLGTGDGGPWRARLGDALPSPQALLRYQLRWAVTHELLARVDLLARHGADVASAFEDGLTPAELAARHGHADIVAVLVRHGAAPPRLTPVDALAAAALAGDGPAVDRLIAEHPGLVAQARAEHPALLVAAAATGRSDAVELLARLGFDVNARGRSDRAGPEPWETALHAAVERGDDALVTLLLALGADPSIRDARFDATPLDWAEHLHKPSLVLLLRTDR